MAIDPSEVNLPQEEREKRSDWRQVEAGVRRSMSYPRNAANAFISFLEDVRDFMEANGGKIKAAPTAKSKPPVTIPSELLALPEKVAELTALVESLQAQLAGGTAPEPADESGTQTGTPEPTTETAPKTTPANPEVI